MIPQRTFGPVTATAATSLSVLGLGCWSFGGGDYWGSQDPRQEDALVARALDLGINYFDTAEGYNDGRSEEALGRALKRALGTRRHQALVGTKVAPSNTDPPLLRQHCEASLRRLGVETIDLYMVHWPISDRPIEPAFAALQALQAEGKIRLIGVSNFGPQQLQEAQTALSLGAPTDPVGAHGVRPHGSAFMPLRPGTRIEANQLCYNLLSRSIELELIPLCIRLGIGILAYSPLMQGLLTGQFTSADQLPAVRTRTRHFRGDRPGSRHGEPGLEDEVFTALAQVRQIAEELQTPLSQLALAWILSRPAITTVIAGARDLNQLEHNARAAALVLPPEIVARLDQATEPVLRKLGPSIDYYQASDHGRSW